MGNERQRGQQQRVGNEWQRKPPEEEETRLVFFFRFNTILSKSSYLNVSPVRHRRTRKNHYSVIFVVFFFFSEFVLSLCRHVLPPGRVLLVKTGRPAAALLLHRGRRHVFRFRRRETHVTGTHVASAHQQIHQHAIGRALLGRFFLFAPFPRRRGRCGVRSQALYAVRSAFGIVCESPAKKNKKNHHVKTRYFFFLRVQSLSFPVSHLLLR